MPFIITNRARHLLIVPLNSSVTLYLAPGESSEAIEEYELENNESAQKLMHENLLTAVSSEQAQAPASVGSKREPNKFPQRSRRKKRGA